MLKSRVNQWNELFGQKHFKRIFLMFALKIMAKMLCFHIVIFSFEKCNYLVVKKLTAQVKALFSQPMINGVRKPAPSILSQNLKKYRKLFPQVSS